MLDLDSIDANLKGLRKRDLSSTHINRSVEGNIIDIDSTITSYNNKQ